MDKKERYLRDLAVLKKLAREDQEVGKAGPHTSKKGKSGYTRKSKHKKRIEDYENDDIGC